VVSSLSAASWCCYWKLYNHHELKRKQQTPSEVELKQQLVQSQELRQAERRGRIRAEIDLRAAVASASASAAAASAHSLQDPTAVEGGGDGTLAPCPRTRTFAMQEIGTVVSPFVKRMGTPRQGLLAPHARGYVQMNSGDATSLLDGIQDYSHLWILFEFHANTNTHRQNQHQNQYQSQTNPSWQSQQQQQQGGEGHGNNGSNKGKQTRGRSTKVKPPRAPPGTKVGQLATRSPHRPNAIGLSLVKCDSYDPKKKRLHISALDLVNGTPVYDIKPYVPWDDPKTAMRLLSMSMPLSSNNSNININLNNGNLNNDNDAGSNATVTVLDMDHTNNILTNNIHMDTDIRVPAWVDQEDTIPLVTFTEEARTSLEQCLFRGHLEPLYSSSGNNKSNKRTNTDNDDNEDDNEDEKKNQEIQNNHHHLNLNDAQQAICEILAQDPRASHTRNVNAKSKNEDKEKRDESTTIAASTSTSASYRIMFCAVEVEFQVIIVSPSSPSSTPTNSDTHTNNTTHTENKQVQVLSVTHVNLNQAASAEGIPLIGM
jgi:tRNA (Thr-GGU) A37 N-methylase